MTQRYAKLARAHIIKTGDIAKLIWTIMEKKPVQESTAQEQTMQSA